MSFMLDIPDIPDIGPRELEDRLNNYYRYLESVRERLPLSAYNYAVGPWHNSFAPEAPHDAWFEDVVVRVAASGKRSEKRITHIHLRLLGAYQNGFIHLHYKNVHRFSLCDVHEWMYDEIRLSEEGYVEHEIRFDSNSRWLIHCDDFSYEWEPFEAVNNNSGLIPSQEIPG